MPSQTAVTCSLPFHLSLISYLGFLEFLKSSISEYSVSESVSEYSVLENPVSEFVSEHFEMQNGLLDHHFSRCCSTVTDINDSLISE